jgi:hypothetical protein
MTSSDAARGAASPKSSGAARAATIDPITLAALLSPARAAASRRNGAKSCGPKTPQGKACSSQNALKHGLRAQKFVVVAGESPKEFEALEAALVEELAPDGALQGLLAARIARAAWRLERAERIEAGLFEHHLRGERNLGVALIRDGNGARAFDTLLRYRGTTLAELWRALRLLKALQAETAAGPQAMREVQRAAIEQQPIEPEARRNPGGIAPAQAGRGSAFDGAGGEAAHQRPLDQREQQHDRDDADDAARGERAPGQLELADHELQADRPGARARARGHHEREQELAPGADRDEHHGRDQAAHDERQDRAHHGADPRAAVDPGRVLELDRDGIEKCLPASGC